jgi:hypothetical protein
MSTTGIKFIPDVLRSIDSATFTGSYQTVGGVLTHNARVVKFTNNSTSLVTISWDGSVDHDVLPAGSFLLIDVTTNRDAVEDQCLVGIGTQFYVKGSVGTGLFYISNYYTV